MAAGVGVALSPSRSTCASKVLSGSGHRHPEAYALLGSGEGCIQPSTAHLRGPVLRTAAFHHFPPINLGKCVSSSADGTHRQQVLMTITGSNIYQVPESNGFCKIKTVL